MIAEVRGQIEEVSSQFSVSVIRFAAEGRGENAWKRQRAVEGVEFPSTSRLLRFACIRSAQDDNNVYKSGAGNGIVTGVDGD